MAWTTIELSAATRDRLEAVGGSSYEATVVEELDSLEAERFWRQAETAAAWRRSQSDARRAALEARDRVLDNLG